MSWGFPDAVFVVFHNTHITQLKPAVVTPDAIVTNASRLSAVVKADLSINNMCSDRVHL